MRFVTACGAIRTAWKGPAMWIRLTLLLPLIVPACSRQSGDNGTAATKASSIQEEAWTAIRGGSLLVDVRSQQEYDQGHLEGALLIPHDEIASRASELGSDKSRPIVLYCRSGNRSSQAKRTLEELGYTHVMNAGGYESLKHDAPMSN